MIPAIFVFSTIILILTIFKIEWGLGLYLLYFFLVPLTALYAFSLPIGYNLYYLILIGVVFIWIRTKNNLKKNQGSLMTPFLFLFVAQAALIPFHFSEMPISDQLNIFRIDIMSLILPYAIILIGSYSNKNQLLFVNILYGAIVISSIYTLILLTRLGQNPYIEALTPLFSSYNDTSDYIQKILDEGVRIFGYISSVYKYVTDYGVFLIFASVFLLRQLSNTKVWMPRLLYGLILVCIFVCGSRSVLMAEGLVILAYLILQRRFKLFLGGMGIFVFIFFLVQEFLPDYLLFVSSVRDDSIAGSSMNMRMDQFKGCIESLENNPLFGHGYSWTGWYSNTYGKHTSMLSFESCLIQILCNNGIMGVVIWISFVVILLRNAKKSFTRDKGFYQSIALLLVGYFSYTFFTGDYGAIRVLMVFYALLVVNENRSLSNGMPSTLGNIVNSSNSKQYSIL